jgi:diadenosine tetraphosphate (Ap4A) HIT family hydrolase
VPHLHFHFLPRAEGDGVSLWPQLPGSSADLDALLRWADEP